MDKRKMEKTSALLITVTVVCISLLYTADWSSVGIYAGCAWQNRLLYPFFHANILHASLNAWCILSMIFIYDISITRLILSFIIAITIPIDTISSLIGSMNVPTVGLSGVVFILFGSISFEVKRKWYYQIWMSFYLIVGFLFPNTNAWLHLYCYLAGLVVALFNKPIVICDNNG